MLFVLIFFVILLAQKPDKWQASKSTHFVVYYQNAPLDFVGEVVNKSEEYYEKIADNLGFRRFNFWLWDNRAKIYIYDDAGAYQAGTGQPAWSAGCAVVPVKTIHTYPYARGFFDTILPHEMGHIIFRELVGFYNFAIPTWLEEGVASYQETLDESIIKRLLFLKIVMDKGTLINLVKLSELNPRFIQGEAGVQLFYAEAVSVIYYLISEFGKDKFVLFCENLRDKKNLERAIASTYSFKNLQELNDAWLAYLKK